MKLAQLLLVVFCLGFAVPTWAQSNVTITNPPGGTGATVPMFSGTAGSTGNTSIQNAPITVNPSTNNVTASINTQVNVMDYGAYGDCSHDDTAAFTAAQTAAFGYPGLPASIFLPKPSGGCYIVSNWTWTGAPLVGQPSGLGGNGTGHGNVILKSKPGQDILHIPDPTYTTGTVTLIEGWQIRNVTFQVDNSATGISGWSSTTSYALGNQVTYSSKIYTSTINSNSNNVPGTNGDWVVSFPHRWPGRWIDDVSVANSGSNAYLTTSGNIISCGDVGQAITIGGAGTTATSDTLGAAITSTTQKTVTLTTGLTNSWPSVFAYIEVDSEIMLVEVQGLPNGTISLTNIQRGQAGTTAATHSSGATVTVMGNLTTTIQSVSPCWTSPTTRSLNVVQLATTVSNSISKAHTYISVLGLPASENVGNCAIAMDMEDGNSADWTGTTSGGNYGKMENVLFTTTTGSSYDVCGVFTQGNPYLYGVTVNNFGLYNQEYGVVQATTELNSALQSSSGDYEHWSDGIVLFTLTPWISYNGLSQSLENVQLTSFAGPQVLIANNAGSDTANGWHVKNSGFETPYSATPYGWRVEGSGHSFDGVSLTSGATGQNGYWDAVSSTCNCSAVNTYVNGYGNSFATGGGILGGTSVNNHAYQNYNGNPYGGMPYGYNAALMPYKGAYNLAGRFTADFAFDNNGALPAGLNYTHDDLIIWPQDIMLNFSFGYSNQLAQDSTSPSGYYLIMNPTQGGYVQFVQFTERGITGNNLVAGQSLPTTGATVYFQAKCPSGTTSFTFSAGFFGGSANSGTYACSTSYQNYSLAMGFKSSDSGKFFQLIPTGSNTFYVSYFVIVPWKGDYNYYQPALSNNEVVWNFSNWPSWNNAYNATDTGSPYGAVKGSYGSGGTYITTTPGKDFPAVPSKVSYWVGSPLVFSDTLGAAVTSTATTITLGTSTTSAWGSSGYILIDGEVMHYTGVTSGLTSITVSRGQYGTVAAAHASGEAITNTGVGTAAITCNGATVSNANVFFPPSYATFSAPFPAQQCAGYQTNVAVLNSQSGASNYYFAQVKITPDEEWLAVPTAVNQVPVSSSNGAMNTFGSTLPLAGSGTNIGTVVVGSGTLTYSSIAAQTCQEQTISVSGATTNNYGATASPRASVGNSNLSWSAWVSASGTVSVRVCNTSAAAITPTAVTWGATVSQ